MEVINENTKTSKRKRKIPDQEYYQWKKAFVEKLRNTPEEKLSPAAKYWLEEESKENEWITSDVEAVFG